MGRDLGKSSTRYMLLSSAVPWDTSPFCLMAVRPRLRPVPGKTSPGKNGSPLRPVLQDTSLAYWDLAGQE